MVPKFHHLDKYMALGQNSTVFIIGIKMLDSSKPMSRCGIIQLGATVLTTIVDSPQAKAGPILRLLDDLCIFSTI